MTTTPTDTDSTGGLHIPAHAAEQFAFHLRLAIAAGTGDDATSAACEPLLAWGVLAAAVPEIDRLAASAESELISARVATGSAAHRSAVAAAATARAMELEAHYVSVGNHAVAGLYAEVADNVESILDQTLGT